MSFKKYIPLLLCSALVAQTTFADDLLEILAGKNNVKDSGLVVEKSDLVNTIKRSLGRTTAEQNIFLNFLDQGDYKKALFQWWSAFDRSSFSKTDNGKALFALLTFKNDLPVIALEFLFKVQNPRNISKELVRLWKLEAPETHEAWKFARIQWTPAWESVFSPEIGVRVLANRMDSQLRDDYIMALLKKSKAGSEDRERLEWKMVLVLALQDKQEKAVKVLSHLLQNSQGHISKDLMNLTASRMLYEKGFLQASIEYLNKIPKSSEYWFVAQEEMAWAYIRKGEPQNVLGTTKGLMIEGFDAYVGPESVFLRSIAQLKVCDYPGVMESIETFKRRYRDRAAALMATSKNENTVAINKVIDSLKKKKLTRASLKEYGNVLPRYISRDESLYHLAQVERMLEKEAKKSGQLYTQSLSEGSDRIGFSAKFDFLKSSIESRIQSTRSAAVNLVRKRAQSEVAEIQQILQKMHIVEAEMIQQIDLSDRIISSNQGGTIENKKGSTGSQDKYALSFPYDGELWFDEISNYRVDIKKGCQVSSAR